MYDIIIIGAGPAGMTAALYALRAGKKVLIIEKETFGGQITFSPNVENYPGTKSMSGSEFADKLLDQIMELGVETEFEEVTDIDILEKTKKVYCENKLFESKAIIIATGAKHRELGIEGEKELVGKGISYCAVCDGAFFKGKDVAVAGGGNTALQDAIYLSEGGCNKVYIIHRRDQFRGDKKLVDKLRTFSNVEFIMSSTIEELVYDNEGLKGLKISSRENDQKSQISLDGLFVAVGQEPSNKCFKNKIRLDDAGYVDADESCFTDIEGVFVAGDCRKKNIKQLTTAVGDGASAAIAACEYID